MKKKKKFTEVISLVMILVLICPSVYATEKLGKEDKISTLKLFLGSEIQKDVRNVDDDVQKLLNKLGLFNSEIEVIESEFLDNILKAEVANVQVKTQYIMCSIDNVTDSFYEWELSDSEVDDLVEAIYIDGDTGEFVNSTDYVAKQIPTAYASSTTQNAVIKKSVVSTIVTRNGKRKLSCTYICTWLTNPTKRMIDIMSIGWGTGQGSFDYTEPYYAKYTCVRDTEWYTSNGNNTYTKHTESEGYEYNLTSSMRNTATENGLSCKIDLKDDSSDVVNTVTYENLYRNHVVSMNFYLTNISNSSYTYFVGQYYQQKKKGGFSINGISVTFNLQGYLKITLSGGYATSDYYSTIGDNLLLNCVH